MIGNLQYAWTLFAQPMVKAHAQQHWTLSDVQWGFGLFIAAGTWAMPFLARFIDTAGPRILMVLSGLVCAIGWGSLGHVENLTSFYLLYCLAGVGVACVYACGVAIAVKWFPDRRGTASGLITAGYGMGAAVFNPLFNHLIRTIGYSDTFLWTGISHGIVIALAGLVLINPPAGYTVAAGAVKPKVRSLNIDFNYAEMLRTPQFYFLFIAMLSIGIGGLMVTAQLKPVATNFKVGEAALTVALVLTPLANGSSRILWGWVSDYLGREWTMFTAFLLQAIFLVAATTLGRAGDVMFVVMMVMVFALTWGELYVCCSPRCSPICTGPKIRRSITTALIAASRALRRAWAKKRSGIAATMFEKTGTLELRVPRERRARSGFGNVSPVCPQNAASAKSQAAKSFSVQPSVGLTPRAKPNTAHNNISAVFCFWRTADATHGCRTSFRQQDLVTSALGCLRRPFHRAKFRRF